MEDAVRDDDNDKEDKKTTKTVKTKQATNKMLATIANNCDEVLAFL